ncbi:flagellar basal body P-ring protein FlgI [Lichenihabitans sp. Uapishka_5]|uniref:flagellar basal body P-ring protein FlgI n=1 Tax=Lichenihabitans sp. Uapishka_5 TaxID=3037302 RepID=UPI0029E8217D|nr:flagellar basal body P-ring protein FlgI [Lichenihabitans sp. Uapishka_5]MDX7952985.1 flagellar basal body P-ring protein FlgI [Lichenihabitans sp. Uapishka_5]
MRRLLLGLAAALLWAAPAATVLWAAPAVAAVRIKDIAALGGMRDNQLVGYGIVVGLLGTGDTMRNAPFTEQSMQSMLDKMGINVRGVSLRARNVAGVIVTANLPPLIDRGAAIDVTVSSLGDSTSLLGGTLIMTPLIGGDGQTHAVAQGPVSVSGNAQAGQAETYSQGVPSGGRIANGAIVELPAPNDFGRTGSLALDLRNPDFKTAVRVADAVNLFARTRFHTRVAQEQDLRRIMVTCPPGISPTRFMAEIGDLTVEPDTPARVVIDERTGTVVIGQDVQISTVAVTHGSLTVRITETPIASQPAPLSGGKTVVLPTTNIEADESGGQLRIVGGTTLKSLVKGLNAIGLKPTGIIAILQAIKSAGALQADLVAQ